MFDRFAAHRPPTNRNLDPPAPKDSGLIACKYPHAAVPRRAMIGRERSGHRSPRRTDNGFSPQLGPKYAVQPSRDERDRTRPGLCTATCTES